MLSESRTVPDPVGVEQMAVSGRGFDFEKALNVKFAEGWRLVPGGLTATAVSGITGATWSDTVFIVAVLQRDAPAKERN